MAKSLKSSSCLIRRRRNLADSDSCLSQKRAHAPELSVNTTSISRTSKLRLKEQSPEPTSPMRRESLERIHRRHIQREIRGTTSHPTDITRLVFHLPLLHHHRIQQQQHTQAGAHHRLQLKRLHLQHTHRNTPIHLLVMLLVHQLLQLPRPAGVLHPKLRPRPPGDTAMPRRPLAVSQ